MKLFRKFALTTMCIVTTVILIAGLTACGNNDVKAKFVEVDKQKIELNINDTTDVKATLTAAEDGKTVTEKITWEMEDSSIATVTVSDDGLTATVKGIKAGSTTLTAKIADEDGWAFVDITVKKPLGNEIRKVSKDENNYITFYDSNQYVVNSVFAALNLPITYQGNYSIDNGNLVLEDVIFVPMNPYEYEAGHIYTALKDSAKLSTYAVSNDANKTRIDFFEVTFSAEDMIALNLPFNTNVKEVANIAVTSTGADKVKTLEAAQAAATGCSHVINLISSQNEVSDATKALDVAPFFTAVDKNGEDPTDGTLKYEVSKLTTGTVRIDGSKINGITAGYAKLTITSISNEDVKLNVLLAVAYPSDSVVPNVANYNLENDTHFDEETVFEATYQITVGTATVNATRTLEFGTDGVVVMKVMGNLASAGYYKLTADGIQFDMFNGDFKNVNKDFETLTDSELRKFDAKTEPNADGVYYEMTFEEKEANKVTALAVAKNNGNAEFTFMSDKTFTCATNQLVTGTWSLTKDLVLSMKVNNVAIYTGEATITTTGSAADYSLVYHISIAVKDGDTTIQTITADMTIVEGAALGAYVDQVTALAVAKNDGNAEFTFMDDKTFTCATNQLVTGTWTLTKTLELTMTVNPVAGYTGEATITTTGSAADYSLVYHISVAVKNGDTTIQTITADMTIVEGAGLGQYAE